MNEKDFALLIAAVRRFPQINADGRLVMPDAPGLGLAFDEARLASAAL